MLNLIYTLIKIRIPCRQLFSGDHHKIKFGKIRPFSSNKRLSRYKLQKRLPIKRYFENDCFFGRCRVIIFAHGLILKNFWYIIAPIAPKNTYSDAVFISINISAPLIFIQGETMKTTIIAMILTFSLGLVGCVTTQSGSGSSSAGNGGTTSGKMLTDEDYKRIGIKETGVR